MFFERRNVGYLQLGLVFKIDFKKPLHVRDTIV